jgi:hypothetical protein
MKEFIRSRNMSPRLQRCPSIVAIIIGLLTAGCERTQSTPELEARRQAIKLQETNMSPEALDRKARSIAILKKENVPYIDHLPVIETEAGSKRRTTEEVATRAMALCVVAVKGEGLEQEIIDKLVKEYRLETALSPKERAFIHNTHPTQRERAQFTWRYEGYSVLLWALGFTEKLDRPETMCDVQKIVSFLHDNGRDKFVEKARLRPQSEILDATDLTYRYFWATEDARVKHAKEPAKLNGEVLMERLHALNWLIGYMGQQWDDISTDT